MPTPLEVHCFLELSALNDASDEARRYLDAPRPTAGDTGPYPSVRAARKKQKQPRTERINKGIRGIE
jgi:hypothetical protein